MKAIDAMTADECWAELKQAGKLPPLWYALVGPFRHRNLVEYLRSRLRAVREERKVTK